MPRLNLSIDQRSLTTIEDIRERLGASSAAEVVRRAVTCLDVVSKANAQGAVVVLRREDGTEREIRLL